MEREVREVLEAAYEAMFPFGTHRQRGMTGAQSDRQRGRFRRFLDAEAYTDAALMLVPEGAKWAVTSRNSACCSMDHVAPLDWVYSTHPALAIAQAALKTKDTEHAPE